MNQALEGGLVEIQQLENPAGEGICHFADEHTLFVSLSAKPVHYLQSQDGETHTGLYQRGDLSLVPASSRLFARWQDAENCLQIRLTREFVQSVARETLAQDGDRIQLQLAFQARSPQLESISLMLLSEHQQGGLGGRLYTDSLANILAVSLLREYAIAKIQLPVYQGGLPPRQLRQVLDYMDAHLARDIKLAELAQLLNMSQYHFSRLFKQSVSRSPYQYLLQQRVERAKQLLKQTDRLITDIAFDCGFNSHSHLSNQFRQLTGMTPKAYRGQR